MEQTADSITQDLIALLPRMRRFGMALTRRLDRADDLVQDTCERALTRRTQFRHGSRFDSWVFTIMRSVWLNQIRSDKVRTADGPGALVAVADPLAERRAEAGVALSDLDRHLLDLPLEQREVVMLVSVEGYTYQEAADILDIPVGTVMSRLSRARVSLARTYQS